MKIILSRPELVHLIGTIQSIVSSKPPIPILANVSIEAKGNELTLRATDLTVSIQGQMEASILQEGAITLPARHFFQLIRELTTPEIQIEVVNDAIARIESAHSKFEIKGMHHSEFPSFPDLTQEKSFTIEAASFKEMLSKSMFAAAKEDPRHVLNGVLMQIEKKTAIFTGTDGKRLSRVTTAIESDSTASHRSLIPLKAVEEISRLLDGKTPVKITLMSDKIGFECGPTRLITQLLSGEYPDVERIIPKETVFRVSLHREELMTLLKQVALFTSDKNHSVHFTFTSGELILKAQSSDFGQGTVSMPVDYNGDPFEIAFNPFFFNDILRHCKDETVSFAMTTPYNPGLITDFTAAQFVLMPMRLATM